MKKYGGEIAGLVSFLVTIAFLSGLLIWVYHIILNRYPHYGMYNLMLFDLRDYTDHYFPAFFLILFLVAALSVLISKSLRSRGIRSRITVNQAGLIACSLIVSAIIVFIPAYASYTLFPKIITLLKGYNVTSKLGEISSSPGETFVIYMMVVGVAGIILISCLTYLVYKTSIPAVMMRLSRRVIGSHTTWGAGVASVLVFMCVNTLIPLYKEYNKPEGPNVILILIDTLRADHLGAYGYIRDTSPNIDKFADQSILFEKAYSQASWTYPSVSSIQTSLYPSQIGKLNAKYVLNDSVLTLAEFMKNNFYETIAVVSNTFVSRGWGLSQGYDIFNQEYLSAPNGVTSRLVTDKAVEYIRQYKNTPFFLWIHYMDPHAAYVHHPEYSYRKENTSGIRGDLIEANLNNIKDSLGPTDIRYIIDTYDEEISFTDENVGRLLDSLSELGLNRNTIIILSSDHGEEFKERSGFGHATTLYNELIHVPLIVHIPSENTQKGSRVTQNVEVRNIAKTIIGLCGLHDIDFGGKNLIEIAAGRLPDGIIYSQHSNANGEALYKKAAIDGSWKMIVNTDTGRSELYDLESDPLERTNLVGSADEKTAKERNILSSALAGFNPEKVAESKTAVINDEDLKRLKSLGYVQ